MKKYPFFLIPGNHDVYTQDTASAMPIYEHFAHVMNTKDSIKRASEHLADGSSSTLSNGGDTESPFIHEKYPTIGLFRHKNMCVIGMFL